ncbi:MAG: hypothetical protein ACLVE0_12310 [Parabacteroides distasonis]|jgi:hypothetical protein
MASKEANRAKYQYNKKYMERYWERRAQKENGTLTSESVKTSETVTIKTTKAANTVIVNEAELLDWLLPEPHVTEVTVSRNGQSDAQYIKALETANKTINTENARLQKLLIKYQDIVRTGLKAIMFDIENCKSL